MMPAQVDSQVTTTEGIGTMDQERVNVTAKGVAGYLWRMHQALRGDVDCAAGVVEDATGMTWGAFLALAEDERADVLRGAVLGYADEVMALRAVPDGELRAVVLRVCSSPVVEVELPACGVADGEVRAYSGGASAVRSAQSQAVAEVFVEYVEGVQG